MEGFSNLLLIGIIIGIVLYFKNKRKEAKAKQEEQEKQEELQREEQAKLKWEEKKKEFSTNGLPTLTIDTLLLAKNELCHFIGDAYYCELKQETVGYESGNRGVSLRLMKGLSFHVGNYRGHYVKNDITEQTSGLIYLTNKKIIFTAIKNSTVIKYNDIVNLNVIDDMLHIQTEKKSYFFQIVDSFNFLVILEYIINQIEEEKTLNNDSN